MPNIIDDGLTFTEILTNTNKSNFIEKLHLAVENESPEVGDIDLFLKWGFPLTSD